MNVLWLFLLLIDMSASLTTLDNISVKSVQSALSDLLTTSATHGTFSRPSMKRGLILTLFWRGPGVPYIGRGRAKKPPPPG